MYSRYDSWIKKIQNKPFVKSVARTTEEELMVKGGLVFVPCFLRVIKKFILNQGALKNSFYGNCASKIYAIVQ